MWKNRQDATYFFPRPNICYNINTRDLFKVELARRKEWESNGNNKRIGPDMLGSWEE